MGAPMLGNSPFAQLADALSSAWRLIARPEQLAPEGDWSIWLALAGRGWGKTRSGSEWIHEEVNEGRGRYIALVAPTAADARDVMVEGQSGIIATAPPRQRPVYEPSKRRLTWPNGAVASLFSADEPERLRGPQFDTAWCDELGTWRYAQAAWDNLMLGLRVGANPRAFVSTTPRPIKILKELLSRAGKDVVVTRGRTQDNAENLARPFLTSIVGRYGGTRLGRQELEGELLEDVPGALWQRIWIDRDRVDAAPQLKRIVVAVDPAVSTGEDSDETGIIVAGVGPDGHGYVLDDLSGRYAPHEWAQKAIGAYNRWQADRIIAEVNNGGQMVESTLKMIGPSVPFKAVHASRGKVMRAEPVSALYEQQRVHHVGMLPLLEDQQCAFSSDFDRSRAGYSPDRLDALVWALSELMVDAAFRSGNIITQFHGGPNGLGQMTSRYVNGVRVWPPEPIALSLSPTEIAARQQQLTEEAQSRLDESLTNLRLAKITPRPTKGMRVGLYQRG
jgi:predicted phage terminase large subunit-like protein